MNSILYDFFINLSSDVLTAFCLFPLIYVGVATIISTRRRSKLAAFFNLDPDYPHITVFVSRHSTLTKIPTIPLDESADKSTEIARLKAIQDQESALEDKETDIAKEFTAVSAIEMIEFFRLKEDIERPMILDRLPREVKENLYNYRFAVTGIEVIFEVCPEPTAYHKLLRPGTLIFIGGPRANLGAYYYLYGQQTGQVRSRRKTKEKEIVEYIANSSTIYKGSPERNLSIIQRFEDKAAGRTLIFLSGTGIHGTAAAVAYLRRHWNKLHKQYKKENFSIILECERRKHDDLTHYVSKEWTDNDWNVLKG